MSGIHIERIAVNPEVLRHISTSQKEVILTQKQLESCLGVSPMTVYLWRKQDPPLPCRTVPTEGGRHRVFFVYSEIYNWITQYRPDRLKKLGGNHASQFTPRPGRVVLPDTQRSAA